MSATTMIVTIFAAGWVGFSAYALAARKPFVTEGLEAYGVPQSWWPWLSAAKALGALGLLTGLAIPSLGVAAAIGLVLYFLGAIATVIRAHAYAHIPFPLIYLVPSAFAGFLLATT